MMIMIVMSPLATGDVSTHDATRAVGGDVSGPILRGDPVPANGGSITLTDLLSLPEGACMGCAPWRARMLGDVGRTNSARLAPGVGHPPRSAVNADVLLLHDRTPFSTLPCGVTISQRGEGSGVRLEVAITQTTSEPAIAHAST